MHYYSEADADPALIRNKTVVILGYGNQGRAHALNLRDSGVADVRVAQRDGSSAIAAAKEDGFTVMSNREAAAIADVLMVLAPDEAHAQIWQDDLSGRMKEGATLAFAHGLSVHFGLVEPDPKLDVILVAPKGPGHALRARYEAGGGLPALFAVAQDSSGRAKDTALAYGAALSAGDALLLETSFRAECETDLFGEQTVLCGGISNLIMAGFDTLVEAGYPEELAYFECLHEAKLTVDLIHERGIAGMRQAISNTAEYGDYSAGSRIVDDRVRAEMRAILKEIQDGGFVRGFVADNAAGGPAMQAGRERQQSHRSEAVGARLRTAMGLGPKRP